MISRYGLTTYVELERLKAIAEYQHRLADEATAVYAAALVRAEGTPLLDPLEEQAAWMRGK